MARFGQFISSDWRGPGRTRTTLTALATLPNMACLLVGVPVVVYNISRCWP